MTVDISPYAIAIVVIIAVAGSFFVSASAGLGGSLILVPTMSLLLGSKEGIALSSLLLAANNLVKLVAYRRVLPLRPVMPILVLTVVGAFVGASLLVAAPDRLVSIAVIAAFGATFIAERRHVEIRSVTFAPGLALASGATSGFSGTSGPLKGVAIRSLGLDRWHTVGAAALVSGFGDITKTVVFTQSALISGSSYRLALFAAPLMVLATFAGRRFNDAIGERGYARLFWLVMGGYTTRLLLLA